MWDFDDKITAFGLVLDIGPVDFFPCTMAPNLCRNVANAVLTLVVVRFLRDIFCNSFRDLFYRRVSQGPFQYNIGDTRGGVNKAVLELYDLVKEHVETPLQTKAVS